MYHVVLIDITGPAALAVEEDEEEIAGYEVRAEMMPVSKITATILLRFQWNRRVNPEGSPSNLILPCGQPDCDVGCQQNEPRLTFRGAPLVVHFEKMPKNGFHDRGKKSP